ncbi:MAG TPA: hypothetical protein VFG54_19905 [Prolixibacteraceae bacterium]|nr:hypothetical protein [Prolixibacteraceae bacterium]
MEDYIFLIIAVLISIFGALNQNRKKRLAENQEEQPLSPNPHADPFLDFEMEDLEDEEQVPARKVQEAQAKRARKVNPFLNFEMMDVEDEEEEYERKLKEEQARRAREVQARQINEATRTTFQSNWEARKAKAFESTRFRSTLPDRPKRAGMKPQNILKEEEEASVGQTERSSYLEDFSLRKAVIYSTILERKY